jgi:hypothetical protein
LQIVLRKFPGLLKSIFDVFPDFSFRYTFISDQKKTIQMTIHPNREGFSYAMALIPSSWLGAEAGLG